MTQKEKAKAYDEALERANELNYVSDRDSLQRKTVEYIFPELRDSEENKDEIIKEEIIQFLLLPHPQFVGNRNYEKWIAWLEKQGNANKEYWRGYREGKQEILDKYAELEKQGEQPTLPKWKYKKDHNPLTRDSITLNKYGCVAKSPSGALVSDVWVIDYDELAKLPKEEIDKQNEQKLADKTEPKFKVGDWILYSGDHYEGVRHITKIDEKGYYVERNGLPHCIIPFNHEICMRLWTIADAKDGDILFQDLMGGMTFIYNGVNPETAILYSFIIRNDGKDVLPYHIGKPNTGIGCIKENENIVHPATKEQRDLLFQKMREAGYEWVFEKKELKKIEQTPTSKVEPKFKVGDWIVSNEHPNCVNSLMRIGKVGLTDYLCRDYNGQMTYSLGFIDKNYHLWTIADAKGGDVLYMDNGASTCTFIYKSVNNGIVQKYASYNKFGFEGTTYLVLNDGYICPATKEQRDTLFAKMKEARYEWNADKKELMKIEQNLTVTDEELAKAKKDAYNDALDKNEYHSGEPTFDDGWSAAIWYLKKRNALPQNTWKPSATDIKVLEDVIDLHVNPINYHATLHSILEHLKKLREK